METGFEATLDLRLPLVLKEAVVEAAAHLGQSVDEFAVGVLARSARGHRAPRANRAQRS